MPRPSAFAQHHHFQPTPSMIDALPGSAAPFEPVTLTFVRLAPRTRVRQSLPHADHQTTAARRCSRSDRSFHRGQRPGRGGDASLNGGGCWPCGGTRWDEHCGSRWCSPVASVDRRLDGRRVEGAVVTDGPVVEDGADDARKRWVDHGLWWKKGECSEGDVHAFRASRPQAADAVADTPLPRYHCECLSVSRKCLRRRQSLPRVRVQRRLRLGLVRTFACQLTRVPYHTPEKVGTQGHLFVGNVFSSTKEGAARGRSSYAHGQSARGQT